MKFIVFCLVDDIDLKKKSIFAGELQFKKIAERKSKYIDSDIDSSTGIKRNWSQEREKEKREIDHIYGVFNVTICTISFRLFFPICCFSA